jgi:hypothetical protein
MAELDGDGGEQLTPAQIVQLEERRGSLDWTGPQGNNDAWGLVTDFWNHDAINYLNGAAYATELLGRIG